MKKIYNIPTTKVFAIEAEELIATSLTSDGVDNGLGGTGYGGSTSGAGGGIEADTRGQSSIWDGWND